jgi:hypothetical protein
MLGVVFRRLARKGYHHSVITIVGVQPAGTLPDARGVNVLFAFDRIDRAGATLESSAAVYRLERIGGAWLISECWLFDSIANPPPSLDLDGFRRAPA